jgi:hypothetical protein
MATEIRSRHVISRLLQPRYTTQSPPVHAALRLDVQAQTCQSRCRAEERRLGGQGQPDGQMLGHSILTHGINSPLRCYNRRLRVTLNDPGSPIVCPGLCLLIPSVRFRWMNVRMSACLQTVIFTLWRHQIST